MFNIDYRIVYSEYDEYIGQNGFLQIKCNGYAYGEMYSKELERFVDKVSLCDWFERLIRVAKCLGIKDYVALSDIESYNTWIEFRRINEEVSVSIVKAEKEQGSRDLEFSLKEPVYGEWACQIISYRQFKAEIIKKAEEYIKFISDNNQESPEIIKIKESFEALQKV